MSESWEYGEVADVETAPMRFPWPPVEGESVLVALGDTWKRATFDPGAFYAAVPRNGGTGAAVLYYLVVGILVSGVSLFWSSLAMYSGMFATDTGAAALGFGALHPVVSFLLSPLFLLVMLGVSAAVTHMILSLFDGGRHGFGTTIRVFCYAYSPMLFGVVPWLGGLVGSIWMVVLTILGLKQAHETDGWKTALAVLLPLALLVGLMIFAFLVVMAAGAALLNA